MLEPLAYEYLMKATDAELRAGEQLGMEFPDQWHDSALRVWGGMCL